MPGHAAGGDGSLPRLGEIGVIHVNVSIGLEEVPDSNVGSNQQDC
jgi:hypothetical protein